jgi:solute carrier family 35 protein E1
MRLRRPSRAILTNTWPMAVFQVGGHIFSSMAISRVPVSTVHTIKVSGLASCLPLARKLTSWLVTCSKALSPLFTVLAYALLFKISYSPATYLSLLPLTLGVMLACSFDMSASNILGLMCAFGSTLVFVSQNIVFKKLMPSSGSGTNHGPGSGGPNNSLSTAQTSPKLDKINLLFYSSGMAFLSMIPLWAYSDMPTLLALWLDPDSVHLAAKVNIGAPPSITFYFFLNGTVHFAQNLLAFAILSSTSPVTYSIASLVKRIAVICLAIIWFNQKVHPVQAVGICLTGLGLWMYNAAKRDVEKGEKKVRRMEAVKDGMLPLTRADQKLLDERSEMNTPSLSDTEPYPDRTYGIQDLTLQSTSQINGAYAFNDEKLNRANQYGYAQPYPPATHSLNSPPISGGTALPINGMHIHHKTESASYMNGGTARRRLSNDQNKMVAAIGKYPVDEGKRHVDDEEVLQDIDPR